MLTGLLAVVHPESSHLQSSANDYWRMLVSPPLCHSSLKELFVVAVLLLLLRQ